MKRVLATLIGLFTATCVSTASAHVVVLTTSIPAATATDDAKLREALDDVVSHAIAFTPTTMTLTNVRRIGARIYLELLIVDKDGEALIRELEQGDATAAPEPAPEPVATEATI